MKATKLQLLFFTIAISFFGNSQCNIDLDTNSILRDSVDKTFLPYSLKLANEKPSDLEISLTVSGGVIGDDLYRIYCHKDTLRIKLYRHSFGYDSLIKDYKYKFDTAIEMKFKNITGQNFVDSLVSLNFFTLKNMDSTMKITRDTLENGSIRVNEYEVRNYMCNKTNYNFEYIIGDRTRTYQYEGLNGFLKIIPDRTEFQQAAKIVDFFYTHIE